MLPPVAHSSAVPSPNEGSALRPQMAGPSTFYRADLWRLGQMAARHLSPRVCRWVTHFLASTYWRLNRARRQIVIQNLLPVVDGDPNRATQLSRELFRQFAQKLTDLWRYESGQPIDHLFLPGRGWERFQEARASNRGVLLLTPHLGNWELGAPLLAQRGVRLLVLTMDEPGDGLTELRRRSRLSWGVETLVIGGNTFAFVEVIRRLEEGATVALLIDRPAPGTGTCVQLFGRPFRASMAPAELARASGCLLLPIYLPRLEGGYGAEVLPSIPYDRAALGSRPAREALTQEIMRIFEPVILTHAAQWYHFVSVWPDDRGPCHE